MASTTNMMNTKLADDVIISHSSHQLAHQNDGQLANSDLNPALELSNILQSTLDVETLFQLFVREAQKSVGFSGLEYFNKEIRKSIKFGKKCKHHCNYRLIVGTQKLGSLTVYRPKEFSKSETVALEYLFASLLYPLRNCILYLYALKTALIDPLTGINNRTSFETTLQREIDRCRRYNTNLSLLIADIDHFKKTNDQYGHLYGDCVLREVAQRIQRCIRSSDVLFRYGGEEFAVILSNTCQTGANLTAERIRLAIANADNENGKKDQSQKITISVGGTDLREGDDRELLFERADKALYQAKNAGRNCVCFNSGG